MSMHAGSRNGAATSRPIATADESTSGAGEFNLVLYSLFMAASSLIFGGLSLWHAGEISTGTGNNNASLAAADASLSELFRARISTVNANMRNLVIAYITLLSDVSPQTLVWISSMLCLLVLLAFATNPTDESFRSFLTDSSLHHHLHHFRQDALLASQRRQAADLNADEIDDLTQLEVERAPMHVHAFTNRIAISLRTPAYERRDYGLFGVASATEQDHHGNVQMRFYVGVFGKWWRSHTSNVTKEHRPVEEDSSSKSITSKAQDNQRYWGLLNVFVRDLVPESRSSSTSSPAAHRKGSNSEEPAAQTASEKPTSGKRKKHGNKHRNAASHSPLAPTLSKDASTSYDSKIGDEPGGPERRASGTSSPLQINEANPSGSPLDPAQIQKSSETDTSQPSEAIIDAQAQLEQIRGASEAARQSLQAQLEELRARKRDEDAARIDVKGRTKTLDEHKRQAESVRREAERRLKAANGFREMLKNRMESKAQEMIDLRKREQVSREKAQTSTTEKASTLQRLQSLIVEQRKVEEEAEAELRAMSEKVEALEQKVAEEEANLLAAQELAAERYAHHIGEDAAGQAYMYGNEYFSSPQQANQQHHMPAYLDSLNEQQQQQHPHVSTGYSQQHSPAYEQASTFANVVPQAHSAWPQGFQGAPFAPQARSLAHVAAMLNTDGATDGGEGLDTDAFDPTVLDPIRQPLLSRRFSPFSFDGAAFSAAQDRNNSITPISPYQSDLLPSNLFQNADEDERHDGILPGTRSEQVEAALNRFGLDSSDTSDAGTANDDDMVPVAQQGDAEALTEDQLASDKLSQSSTSSRSWWGGRTRSKERLNASAITPLSDATSAAKADVGEGEVNEDPRVDEAAVGKRRSLSIFPKLTLNPGAKSFRGSIKRGNNAQTHDKTSESDLYSLHRGKDEVVGGGELAMRRAWNASLSQLPVTQNDYESLRRAFEADDQVASRASLDLPSNNAYQAAGLGGQGQGRWPSRFMNDQAMRSTSDSSAFGSSPQQNFLQKRWNTFGNRETVHPSTSWIDEMIMPLDRTTSRGSELSNPSIGDHDARPFAGNANGNKSSRFSLWRSASGVRANQEFADASDIAEGSEATSATTDNASVKSKRSSFLWPSRKTEASNSAAEASGHANDSTQAQDAN